MAAVPRSSTVPGAWCAACSGMKNNDWTVREKPYDLRERLFLFACLMLLPEQDTVIEREPRVDPDRRQPDPQREKETEEDSREDIASRPAPPRLTIRPFGGWKLGVGRGELGSERSEPPPWELTRRFSVRAPDKP